MRATHAFPWATLPVAPSLVDGVLASSGQPLDLATRARYEPRLGASLAGVRVHADRAAQSSADAVGANAYTVGHHLVLGAHANEHTVAHELAHVVQQPRLSPGARFALGPPGSTSERAADRAADRMLRGLPAAPAMRTAVQLARQPKTPPKPKLDDENDGPPRRLLIYADKPLDQEGMFRALLRQVFGLTDVAKQDEIVAEILDTPHAPAITADQIARSPYRWVTVRGDTITYLQVKLGQLGLKIGVPDRSEELEKAIADLHRYIPGGFIDAKNADLERIRRMNKKLASLPAADVARYVRIANATADLELAERSLDAFVAAGDQRVAADLLPPGDPKLNAKRDDLGRLLGPGIGQIAVRDAAQLDRLIALARKLTPDQRAALDGGISPGADGDALEATLQIAIDQGGKLTPGNGTGSGTKSDADKLKDDIAGTWKGVTPGQWKALDRDGRVALARQIAAKQRNLQLEYTATHPGQLVKGMVTAPFKIQEADDEFWKGMGEVVHGKSTWQRIAGFLGGAKATSGWLSAVLTALAVVAFILNPESAMIRLLMSRAIALMIATAAMTMLESEARIQEAGSAPTFEDFQVGTEGAGAAEAAFYSQMAMLALPLAGEVLAKVPVVSRVMPVLRGAQKLGGKGILAARARIITGLKGIKAWAKGAAGTESAPMAQMAAQIRDMTPDQFADALGKDGAMRERLGFDEKSGQLVKDLASTPGGKEVLGKLRTEAAKVVDDAGGIARAEIDGYAEAVDNVIAKLEAATTEAEAQKVIDDAVKDLGEKATARDFQDRVDDYKDARADEAVDRARADADATEQAEADRRALPPEVAAAAPTEVPLQDVKPAEAPEVAKTEAAVEPSRRLDWEGASKLDLDHPPADVQGTPLEPLWREWAKYIRQRLKAQAEGAAPRTPLKWEAYRDFLGKFARGRNFQRAFTARLQGEVGPTKTVAQDAGVISDKLAAKVRAGQEGVKFADQMVWDNEAAQKYAEGKGPPPEVDTFSNKSRDFAAIDEAGQLKQVVEADVKEVLDKYSGRINVRRPGPLHDANVTVREATLVYDESMVPDETVRRDIEKAFNDASKGRVKLRFE